ncbi:hypothetical protein SSX86_029735 [Deinandra increscens subsp. villosa]|uniref:RRM domain-containing protein n=1 Tax=Deinandra increscens subsp. villosa TaxID=3103831 RepID=A0AAP0CFL3_9ASTR
MERESQGERKKDEGWQNPKSKRLKSLEQEGNRRYDRDSSNWTSFYISNFPEEASVEDLKKIFEKHGVMMDLFIARKRNGSGERFGFVKYARVDDKQALEKNLSSIKVGHLKLTVNLERFDRYGQPVHRSHPAGKAGRQSKENNHGSGIGVGNGATYSKGRSFRDVISGGAEMKQIVFPIDDDDDVHHHRWDNASLLGKVTDLDSLNDLKNILGETATVYELKDDVQIVPDILSGFTLRAEQVYQVDHRVTVAFEDEDAYYVEDDHRDG